MSMTLPQYDRLPTGRWLLAALALVAIVQTAVIAWMISDRARLLSSGREVMLTVIPVDPRSLFQGDYVILNYEISELDLPVASSDAFGVPAAVYVTLSRTASGLWERKTVALSHPGRVGADEVVLKGTAQYAWNPTPETTRVRVAYGIESYFVPEGRGKALEEMVRDRKLQVLLAVDGTGRSVIKGIAVDGKLEVEEPLF